MEYIHRGFNHPNGGVSPAKHAGHYPGNNADHTIADHAKQGVEKVKKTYKKVKKKVEGIKQDTLIKHIKLRLWARVIYKRHQTY